MLRPRPNVFVSNVLARAPFSDSMGFTAPIYPPKCVSEWSNVIMVSHGPMELFYPAYILPYFASRRSNSFLLGLSDVYLLWIWFVKIGLYHSLSLGVRLSAELWRNQLVNPIPFPSAHNVDRDAATATKHAKLKLCKSANLLIIP